MKHWHPKFKVLLANILYEKTTWHKEGKSAASLCHKVAAWVSDMFCNFYLVNNYRIATNLATAGAREKISTHLESLELKK